MKGTLLKLIGFWFALVLVYLLVTNFGGVSSILGAIDRTAVNSTAVLQGRTAQLTA